METGECGDDHTFESAFDGAAFASARSLSPILVAEAQPVKELKLLSCVALAALLVVWGVGNAILYAMRAAFLAGWTLLILGVCIGVLCLVVLVGWDELLDLLLKRHGLMWTAIDGTKHYKKKDADSPSVRDENQRDAEVDALEYLFQLKGDNDKRGAD